MSRETKLNALFLSAFLLLSLPGVVILFVKKLDPAARSMADPAYVRRSEVYNNPVIAGSASVRVTPPLTARWVEALCARQFGRTPLRHVAAGGRLQPVMSQARRFELLNVEQSPAGVTIVLLAWLNEFGDERVRGMEARTDGGGIGRLALIEIKPLDVPTDVLHELKEGGFVVPPTRTAMVWLRFETASVTASGTPASGGRLRLTWHTGESKGEDVLDLGGALLEEPASARESASAASDAGMDASERASVICIDREEPASLAN